VECFGVLEQEKNSSNISVSFSAKTNKFLHDIFKRENRLASAVDAVFLKTEINKFVQNFYDNFNDEMKSPIHELLSLGIRQAIIDWL